MFEFTVYRHQDFTTPIWRDGTLAFVSQSTNATIQPDSTVSIEAIYANGRRTLPNILRIANGQSVTLIANAIESVIQKAISERFEALLQEKFNDARIGDVIVASVLDAKIANNGVQFCSARTQNDSIEPSVYANTEQPGFRALVALLRSKNYLDAMPLGIGIQVNEVPEPSQREVMHHRAILSRYA